MTFCAIISEMYPIGWDALVCVLCTQTRTHTHNHIDRENPTDKHIVNMTNNITCIGVQFQHLFMFVYTLGESL